MTSTSTDRRQGVNSGAAIKVPCVAASTGNLTLSGEQTVDGIACVTGDRVFVKSQTTASENGIYVCDTGTWTRALDFDGSYDIVRGTLITVLPSGTVNGATFWRVTNTGTITIGTTSLTFQNAAFSEASAVNFLAAGTDAVQRTAQSKMRDVVSVTDFGTTGDGVADDTAEITACWAAATGTVYYPPGTYLVTTLTHPDKKLIHQGGNNTTTIIKGSGTKVIDCPYRSPVGESQLATFIDLNIRGDGASNTAGSNTGLTINNLGINLERVYVSHCATAIDAQTMVGAVWNQVVAYGASYGVRFRQPAVMVDPTNEGFIYECSFNRVACSTGTAGTGWEVSASQLFSGNVINALSSESVGNGVRMLGTDNFGNGNIYFSPWVERVTNGGYWYQDTMDTTVYHNPYWRSADAGVTNAWGASLHINNSAVFKPQFGETELSIGGISAPSVGVYKWLGVKSYQSLDAAIRRTLWGSNSFYVAGTSTYTTETAQAQDEQIIVSNGTMTGANNIATVTLSPAGDAECMHLEVEFALAGTASGASWGVYKRVCSWNAANAFTETTIGTDVNVNATMTITNTGGAARVITIAVNVGAGNYRVTTRIRAFCGISGNAALGVAIASLI